MSEQPMPTVTVPRIIPPHPRYPGGQDRKVNVDQSEERRSEIAMAAVERASRAEVAVVAKLTAKLESGGLCSGASAGAALSVDPLQVSGGDKPVIKTAADEPVRAPASGAGLSQPPADGEKKLSWIRRQRLPKETVSKLPEVQIFDDSYPGTPEIREGFWAKLKGRGAEKEETEVTARANETPMTKGDSENGSGEIPNRGGLWARLKLLRNFREQPEMADEFSKGPAIESWVDGEDGEAISALAEGPSVRAEEDGESLWGGSWGSPSGSRRRLVASLALAAALICGLWVFWQHDGATPDDGNLTLAVVEADLLNPVHNQLSQFLHRFQFDVNPAGMSGWKDYDTETLAEMLRKNGAALELILLCLAEKDWQPQHPAWRGGNLDGELPWEDLARVKQGEALYLQRRGLEVGAFRAAFDLMEFGRKIQEVEAWPNYFLTGLDIYKRGLETVGQLVDDTRMNSAQLGALQRIFASHLPLQGADLVTFYRASYGLEKAILLGQAVPARPGSFSFHLTQPEGMLFKSNRTLGLFAEGFSRLIADAEKPHYQREATDLSTSASASILDSNRTGRHYFAAAMAPYLEVSEKQALSVAHFEAVRTLFALRRHSLDVGRLPETLAELETNYLKAIPSDPFDGDSLRYSKVQKVVYSAGIDGIDSGGKPGRTGFSNLEEPTLEIPFSAGADSEFH